MAFVREKISKEDFEKYGIGRYEERIPNSLFPNYSYWVIDRERNIYLVTASSGGRDPETHNRHRYIFSVDGDVYDIYICHIGTARKKTLVTRLQTTILGFHSLFFEQ